MVLNYLKAPPEHRNTTFSRFNGGNSISFSCPTERHLNLRREGTWRFRKTSQQNHPFPTAMASCKCLGRGSHKILGFNMTKLGFVHPRLQGFQVILWLFLVGLEVVPLNYAIHLAKKTISPDSGASHQRRSQQNLVSRASQYASGLSLSLLLHTCVIATQGNGAAPPFRDPFGTTSLMICKGLLGPGVDINIGARFIIKVDRYSRVILCHTEKGCLTQQRQPKGEQIRVPCSNQFHTTSYTSLILNQTSTNSILNKTI